MNSAFVDFIANLAETHPDTTVADVLERIAVPISVWDGGRSAAIRFLLRCSTAAARRSVVDLIEVRRLRD